MSVIPKINVGIFNRNNNHHSLDCDSQTTVNFGEVIPTFCRHLIPDSKVKMQHRSLVRLGSMPLPTFGRMSLRDYTVYNKFSDLWRPFDNMLAAQPFTTSDGDSYVPTKVPTFSLGNIVANLIAAYSTIAIYDNSRMGSDGTGAMLTIPTQELDPSISFADARDEFINAVESLGLFQFYRDGSSVFNVTPGKNYLCFDEEVYSGYFRESISEPYEPFGRGGYNVGEVVIPFTATYEDTTTQTLRYTGDLNLIIPETLEGYLEKFQYAFDRTGTLQVAAINYQKSIPGPENYDFIIQNSEYTAYFKFKPILKHLRKIFIGLGLQFSPMSKTKVTPLNLIAYFKSYFEIFRPKREVEYTDTYCYKLSRLMEKPGDIELANASNVSELEECFNRFIMELAKDTYYYFPPDYFSMSLRSTGDNTLDNNELYTIGSLVNNAVSSVTDATDPNNMNVQVRQNSVAIQSGAQYPILQAIAARLLQFTNKNNIIGRSIRDYLRVHLGIEDTNIDDNGVIRIGNDRLDITTQEVVATAQTEVASAGTITPLGEYAGIGHGRGQSGEIDFNSPKCFGVLIVLSTLVPESGYYQGVLRENACSGRFDFFTKSFDAMGYEVIGNFEFKDDYEMSPTTAGEAAGLPSANTLKGFGFVPRYSHYKVGRNILNGDLSLPSMRNGLGAYTLDKMYGRLYHSFSAGLIPTPYRYTDVPQIVSDSMRKLDPTDVLGNFDRIFNYTGKDLDHFIIEQAYNVDVWNSAESLADSFDTFEDGSDTTTVNLSHQ